MPIIPALGRKREDLEFKASLSDILSHYLKKTKQNQKRELVAFKDKENEQDFLRLMQEKNT